MEGSETVKFNLKNTPDEDWKLRHGRKQNPWQIYGVRIEREEYRKLLKKYPEMSLSAFVRTKIAEELEKP